MPTRGRRVERFTWSVLWRDVPAAVWGMTAVLGLLLVLATLLYPPYRGPDEPHHVDLAVALEHGEVSPLWKAGTRQFGHAVSGAEVAVGGRLTEPLRLADQDLAPRGERLSHEQAETMPPEREFPNHLVQHPPGYYLLLAGVLAVLPGWESWDLQKVVTVLRLVSALLVLPLPLIVHATARRVTGSRAVAVVAAAVPLCVPQLVRIGGSVNNDTLTIGASALCTLLLAHVLRGDLSRRTAGWLGLVLGVALLSKGLALGLVPVVTATFLLASVRRRTCSGLAALLVTGAVSGVVGGWWWLRNAALYGTLQPDGRFLDGRKPPAAAVVGWADGGADWARSFVELFTYRFFFDDPSGFAPFGTASVLAIGAALLAAVLVLLALLPRRRSPDELRLGDSLVLLAPLPLYVAVVAVGSYEAFTLGAPLAAMQGRYAFGALCGLAVLVAAGLCRAVPRRWHRLLPVTVLAGAAGMHLLAVFSTVRVLWWSPEAGVTGTARAFLEVSPWPPPAVVVLLAAAAAAVAATAVTVRPSSALGSADGDVDDRPRGRSATIRPVADDPATAVRPAEPLEVPGGR